MSPVGIEMASCDSRFPRARGCTHAVWRQRRLLRGLPAYAGFTGSNRVRTSCHIDIPVYAGIHPRSPIATRTGTWLPRVRGFTHATKRRDAEPVMPPRCAQGLPWHRSLTSKACPTLTPHSLELMARRGIRRYYPRCARGCAPAANWTSSRRERSPRIRGWTVVAEMPLLLPSCTCG
jgi:hypothetical protein